MLYLKSMYTRTALFHYVGHKPLYIQMGKCKPLSAFNPVFLHSVWKVDCLIRLVVFAICYKLYESVHCLDDLQQQDYITLMQSHSNVPMLTRKFTFYHSEQTSFHGSCTEKSTVYILQYILKIRLLLTLSQVLA